MIEKLLIWALPVLLAALLSSIIMRKHKANERFNLAGDALREAFAPELTRLQTSEAFGLTEIPDMLKVGFAKHYAAINEFRFFLKGDDLNAFNKAWDQYQNDKNFTKYMMQPDGGGPDNAIEDIQDILKFTKN